MVKMADTDEARAALIQARRMVSLAEQRLIYDRMDNNDRFCLLWTLGYELCQELKEYGIPGEVHGEAKED